MAEAMIESEPGQTVDIELLHNGKKENRKFTLGAIDQSPPPTELPPAYESPKPGEAKGLELGTVKLKIAEFPNEAFAYVPEKYNPNVPYGLVVWLHGEGEFDWKKIVERWKPLCDRYDLILAAPKSIDLKKWTPRDVGLVDKLIEQIDEKYNVDPMRVVVHGHETGGTLASFVALHNREAIRAIAVVDAPLVVVPPDNEPQYRFAVYIATSKKSPAARSIEKVLSTLKEMHVPL